jgi:hypothetical protein
MRRSLDDIRAALAATGGRVAPAARTLGVARNNLYKRIAGSGVNLSEFRGRRPATRPAKEMSAGRRRAAPRIAQRLLAAGPDQGA